jgi:hypothetical protein
MDIFTVVSLFMLVLIFMDMQEVSKPSGDGPKPDKAALEEMTVFLLNFSLRF